MPVYQDKKTKIWKYRTYATDIYGKRKQYEKTGFKTKRDALKAEQELKYGIINDDSKVKFITLWNGYRETIRSKLKKQSYRKIVSKFENHILPYFSNYKLDDITATVYSKWQREIEEKGFKYAYNSSIHGSMVTILNYAIKFYGLKENIASKVGNFSKRNELPKNVDFWTYDEYKQFISVVNDIVYKTFFETLYYSGLRQGEALALTWKDFKDGSLSITKTISKEKENGKHIINSPKTKSSIRIVKLDNDVLKELNELHDYYKRMVQFSDDWFIFGGINPLAPTTIGRKKNEYCEKAKVKKIRIHDFRHSHASLLLSSNVPITVISKRLGHNDIYITLNTYSHLMPEDENKAIIFLNSIKNQK